MHRLPWITFDPESIRMISERYPACVFGGLEQAFRHLSRLGISSPHKLAQGQVDYFGPFEVTTVFPDHHQKLHNGKSRGDFWLSIFGVHWRERRADCVSLGVSLFFCLLRLRVMRTGDPGGAG